MSDRPPRLRATVPRFPPGFLWGTSTSAYQIEGSPLADGAGPSIWHRFAHTPGRVARGETGDVACDHYRRFREDVEWMRALGLTSYRFSISWSRVLPDGTGAVNPPGLDFYSRLADALLEAGIEPMATLYHWDLPAALDDRGGWLNRDSAAWFGEYADRCFGALDDRVRLWITINEPWVVTDGGYLHGVLAPGHRNVFEAPRAAHHLLLAHAAGVEAYRARGRHQIGIALNIEPKYPATRSAADRHAAARADAYMNRHFADPIFLGRYPEELPSIYGEGWHDPAPADLERMRVPIDFLGLNYYTRAVVRHDPAAWPEGAGRVKPRGRVHTETGWEVYPPGLEDTLRRLADRYGPIPIFVTENGAAFDDPRPVRGVVRDEPRVRYLRAHIAAVARAMAAGVDVRGYYVWSLLDNFEWAHGYRKRFGLLRVDPRTLERIPKASARFYAAVIAARGADRGPHATRTSTR